jgi:GxxExxY protein
MHGDTEDTEAAQRYTEENKRALSGAAIGCAMEVHSRLGPGLLESVYEESLCHELTLRGLAFRRQVEVPIRYREVVLAAPLRLDLLIEDALVVEVKSVEAIQPVHQAQLLTYLRMSRYRLGLLINFNVRHLRHGIHRRVL